MLQFLLAQFLPLPGKSGRAFFLFGSHGLPFLVHWVRLFVITLIAWRWQVGTGAA